MKAVKTLVACLVLGCIVASCSSLPVPGSGWREPQVSFENGPFEVRLLDKTGEYKTGYTGPVLLQAETAGATALEELIASKKGRWGLSLIDHAPGSSVRCGDTKVVIYNTLLVIQNEKGPSIECKIRGDESERVLKAIESCVVAKPPPGQ